MKTRTLFVALAFLLPAALLQEHAAADTTFADGTFNNSDWSLTLQTSGNGGTSNATQVTSGGNPGSYYQVYIQSNGDTGNGVGSGTAAFYLNNNFNFTPSSQGAVTSLDFSFDLSTISGAAFAEVAVMQNGNLYLANEHYSTSDAWIHFSDLLLTASDFGLIAPNPNGNGEIGPSSTHPDFAATGSLLQFGFSTVYDSPPGALGGPYSDIFGVDNYLLTLHTSAAVPEPATVYAGAGVVLFLLFFHIKRQRKIAGKF